MSPDAVSSALLVLRVILGVVFLAHGVKHAMGREKTTAWFRSLGFKAPGMQWATITLFEIGAIRMELIELLGVDVDVLTLGALPERWKAEVLHEASAV